MQLHTADGVPTNNATNQNGPRLIHGVSFPPDREMVSMFAIEDKIAFNIMEVGCIAYRP
jgi:hypothetical protein